MENTPKYHRLTIEHNKHISIMIKFSVHICLCPCLYIYIYIYIQIHPACQGARYILNYVLFCIFICLFLCLIDNMQDEFLPAVTASKYCVVHFYHEEFTRCKIIDKHLNYLAPKHMATRFCKLDATKSPFFVQKLQVKTLPTLVIFKVLFLILLLLSVYID